MELTYELIKPLIVKEEPGENNMIELAFQAEGIEKPIETVAVIVPNQAELMKNVMKMAGMAAGTSMAVSGLAGMAGGALGNLGSQAVNMAGSAVTSQMMGNPADMLKGSGSEAEKQAAIVNAFRGVAQFFEYDEGQKKWRGKT
ncbi:MAG: hypothetical protein OHK0011_17070 [Turneriella sp.]